MVRIPKILIAPLNWGLGHATRCIPIIHSLLDHGVDVIIGGDGRPLELLTQEFSSLQTVRLPGLNVSYEGNLAGSIIRHFPHIVLTSYKEHRELDELIDRLGIDAVISDNRFGLYSSRIPSIYVTHQVGIMMPKLLRWAKSPVARAHSLLISRFKECWIPDYQGEINLSAELGHCDPLPNNSFYVGPLSRFRKFPNMRKQYDLIAILSGPEPQRTLFERIVVSQLQNTTLKALIVRGVTETKSRTAITDTISMVSYLTSDELNKAILAADIVLSRPGYSTIMDLTVLETKAIFVPTPGQTEQEYLADHYSRHKIFYSERQAEFQVLRALTEARSYTGMRDTFSEKTCLGTRIQNLLEMIQ